LVLKPYEDPGTINVSLRWL